MVSVFDSIRKLPGIGPKKAELFAKVNIETVYDLLTYFPRAYEDRTQLVDIADLDETAPACFRAMVVKAPKTQLIRKGLELTHVTVADETGSLKLTFFNQKFSAGNLEYGEYYYFYGSRNTEYSGSDMTNPSFEPEDSAKLVTRCILPVYPLTAGLTNKVIQKAVLQAVALCGDEVPDVIPPEVLSKYRLCSADMAYRKIHAPATQADLALAKRRLVFEEYYLFSYSLCLSRARNESYTREPMRDISLKGFYELLPFSPTAGQAKAIKDILQDMSRPTPMHRMVQGDVGSGKTLVALAAMVCAAQNGCQAAFMVPTEILAEQHFAKLSPILEQLGIPAVLLTGGSKAAVRREALEGLETGRYRVAIGTHALFSEAVKYEKLGLVIADEQHRFGVSQRDSLLQKGEHPNLLVMSATPIPRSLALILYGDLEVSVISDKPAGRKPVETYAVGEAMRKRIHAFVRKQVAEGHQVFIVCPAVEDSEENNLKSVETWAETLQAAVFPDLRIGFIHGRLSGAEKEQIMRNFSEQKYDILVSTTVIEVGVDVPNATLMVIENADRFGLSQLHQLRGRVGRGDAQSYCVLFSDSKNGKTQERLKAFCATNDGFEIAESDLKQRGPGDFFGLRQSGEPMFRTANLISDLSILSEAKEACESFLSNPTDYPGYGILQERMAKLFDRAGETLN